MSVFAAATTHRELVENLVLREVKSRYKQSVLGFAWAVLHPLVYALIYTFVGGFLLKQGQPGFPFALHAYFGLLFWNLFQSGLVASTESLVNNLSLITKMNLPREVFPVSAILGKIVDFGFGLVGILPLLIFYRVAPSPGLLLAVPLLALLLLFTTGLGLLCACANLFYRDVRYLVTLATGLWMYLVPNIYTLDRFKGHENLLRIYLLNPVAVFIEAARRLAFPQTGDVTELLPYIGIAAVVSVATFVAGYATFKRYEPRFAESI